MHEDQWFLWYLPLKQEAIRSRTLVYLFRFSCYPLWGSSLFPKSAASLLRIKNPEATAILAARMHAKTLSLVADSWGPQQFCRVRLRCWPFSVFLIRGGRKRETAQNERKSAERMYVWLYELHIARTKTFRGIRKDGSVGVMERAAQEQTCWNHGSHRRQRKKKVGRETRCRLIHNTAPKGDPKGKCGQKSAHPTS